MSDPLDAVRALLADAAPRSARPARRPGRFGDLAAWLETWPGGEARSGLRRMRPLVALYVASAAPEPQATERARARLEHLAAGGGAVSGMARVQGAGVEVFDLALDRPGPDASLRAAMSAREAAATIAFGMEALAKSPDLVVLGDASPGSARAAAALGCALAGGDPAEWSAPDDLDWTRTTVARAALAAAGDPLRMLCEIGGRETAAILGALVAARVQGVPALLDGACALAAAAAARRLAPSALEHVQIAHRPALPAGAGFARDLGLEPLLDVGLVSGDGEGGAAALALVQLAAEPVA